MREIKFRVFYKPDIEFDDKDLMFYQEIIDDDLWFVCHDDGEADPDIRYAFEIPFLDDDWVLMQYTGFKDKNGKEIYEGDIIAIGGNRKLVGHIEYDAPSFVMAWDKARPRVEIINAFKEPIWCNSHISLEVIGNIYENKELLNERD